MRMFIADVLHGTEVLHLSPECRALKRTGNREAFLQDIQAARSLCIVCTGPYVGALNPIRREPVWGG